MQQIILAEHDNGGRFQGHNVAGISPALGEHGSRSDQLSGQTDGNVDLAPIREGLLSLDTSFQNNSYSRGGFHQMKNGLSSIITLDMMRRFFQILSQFGGGNSGKQGAFLQYVIVHHDSPFCLLLFSLYTKNI